MKIRNKIALSLLGLFMIIGLPMSVLNSLNDTLVENSLFLEFLLIWAAGVQSGLNCLHNLFGSIFNSSEPLYESKLSSFPYNLGFLMGQTLIVLALMALFDFIRARGGDDDRDDKPTDSNPPSSGHPGQFRLHGRLRFIRKRISWN